MDRYPRPIAESVADHAESVADHVEFAADRIKSVVDHVESAVDHVESAADRGDAHAAPHRNRISRGDRRVPSNDDADAPSSNWRAEEAIRVLYVDDDPEYLDLVATYLDDHDLAVRTSQSPDGVVDDLDDVDCVVSDYDMPEMDGLELLDAVRDRRPSLPFVLFTGVSREEVAESVADEPVTAFLRKGKPDATIPLLVQRIHRLSEARRVSTLADRALTALETTDDAIAVVAPDETFAVVNQAYRTRLGLNGESLVGRQWHDCYPDGEVSRIQSRALPTVEEGWQWTGRCTAQRGDGEQFATRTRIAGLDDGSLVICHPQATDDD